jgi:hypothetical protein
MPADGHAEHERKPYFLHGFVRIFEGVTRDWLVTIRGNRRDGAMRCNKDRNLLKI